MSDAHPIFVFIGEHFWDMFFGIGSLILTVLVGTVALRLRAALKRRRKS